MDDLLETWATHNRILLYVLDAVAPDALGGTSASKGRSVGQQFAHVHNARLMWLDAAAKDLMDGLTKVEKEQAGDRDLLRSSLERSGEAIATLLRRASEPGARIKNFTRSATTFLAYLVGHDFYHLGEVGIILTQSGHPLDRKISYGMWEWGVR